MMKSILLLSLLCLSAHSADKIAPKVESITPKELLPALNAKDKFRAHAETVRRGLVGSQMTYRAKSAQWFIKYGTVEDVPYLIDSLSDESAHKGAKYPQAGMATTRYWANVALIVICKTSYDYQWNSSREKREYSISLWKQHWERIKPKEK